MSHLMRRDPFDATPFSRMFSRILTEPFFNEQGMSAMIEEGTLPLDVSEDPKSFIVRASLPGFNKEDIDVEIHDGVLSIKATHEEEKEEKTERYYRKERRVGSVSRRVALPGHVQEQAVQAELRDGVLTLRLAKTPENQPRKVKIG